MIVKAWNNGDHNPNGNGYGIKITRRDRDHFFRREWKTILIELEGVRGQVEVNIDKDSFWNNTCRELISKEIGKWLILKHLEHWPLRNPPSFELIPKGERHFIFRTR